MVAMRKLQMLAAALVALSFITAFLAYPAMPARVASHWNLGGEVDGYMGKDMGVYFVPLLTAAVLALIYGLPLLDPKRENYKSFQKEYNGMAAIIAGFMYYVYLLTLAFNLGYSFNFMQLLAPGFGALFLYMGIVLAKAKQNWFVGIRTPWTLSSERVWDRTHLLGSKMFMAAGIVAFLGVAIPQMFMASVAVVIAAAVASVAYSYFEYRKEMKGKKGRKK